MRSETIKITESLDQIDPDEWNQLVPVNSPTLSFQFLNALEKSGCVSEKTGWKPRHVTLHNQNGIVAAVPCYLKFHSWGEFIFDWAWANAYDQAGLTYYPKLLIAVPFTPITGSRLLVKPNQNRIALQKQLTGAVSLLAEEEAVSSVHWLFTTENETTQLTQAGLLPRVSNQFHWNNAGYVSFADFLTALNAKKRKNILRERRRVRDTGIHFRWRTGHEATPTDWQHFYHCYHHTIDDHGSITYLNLDFFLQLAETIPSNVRLLLAEQGGISIAAAFFLCTNDALYGRYWGTVRPIPDLHFETCYYQPIEYCVTHGLNRFEAGAQGEHKLSRGLMPNTIHSAHWLRHPDFYDAIARYTEDEAEHVKQYMNMLERHSPFRKV